jgi:hypothetical protein
MKPRNRQHGSLNISNSRWTAYAVAGLATASGGAISAEAEIHYSGPVNYEFKKESPGYEVHAFPLSRGAFLEGFRYVRGASDNSATLLIEGGAVSHGFRIYSWSFARSVAASLPRGSVVSQGSFNGSGLGRLQDYACEFPDFLEPGIYCAGFRFNSGAGMQYGWVRIKWGGCSANKFIVKDYAWGDPGDQIKVGQTQLDEDEAQVAPQAVKKPAAAPHADSQGSLGLLALGALGLRAWRKSRQVIQS